MSRVWLLAVASALGLVSLLTYVGTFAPAPARGVPHASPTTPLAGVSATTAMVHARSRPAGAPDRRPEDFASVPSAARGVVSAALGDDDPGYRVVGMGARSPVQRLSVSFSRAGVRLESGTTDVRLALQGYGRGATLRAVAPVAPRASGNRVDYAHRGIDEWYVNGPLGLEQGFDVVGRPRGGPGALTLSLRLSGDIRARLRGAGVLLAGPRDALRYTGLRVSDARGRTLRSWLQLARGQLLIRVDDRRAAYPLRIDPFIQQAELGASDGAEGDELGWGVAVSADTIVAGAPLHKVGTHEHQGAVYVFTKPASGWADATQTAELTASDGQAGDRLGREVAISGNTIVAGAPYHKVRENAEQGAVYVFTKPASGWSDATQTAELTASDGEAGQGLGWSVAVSGETVVAGAPGVERFEAPGAAYVFTKPASGWTNATQTAELASSDGEPEDGFGTSVAASGETIVAGAPHHEVGANSEQGAAYVFRKPFSGWANATETAELTASDGAGGDMLGWSVATSGETVVAGALHHQVGANPSQGAAYIYTMPTSGWANATQTAELIASDGAAEDFLGGSVAISGDTVVAGAIGHRTSATGQGAAYVFTMPTLGWTNATQTDELQAPEGAPESYLGFWVAIAGATIVAGAPGQTVGSNERQGLAYAFVNPPPTVSIADPLEGGAYAQGQSVSAAYSCTASPPATLESCTGPVVNGAPIDTSTPGPHSFTVTARDSDGQEASQTVAYTVTLAQKEEHREPRPPPPTVNIAAPVNGDTYLQGQTVTAVYSCTASPPARLEACTGPVANGAPIDTAQLGPHSFTVRARDSYGTEASQTATYAVVRPELAKREIATVVSGTVTIRLDGAQRFVTLTGVQGIPNGSEIDAIHGRVRITVATRTPGQTRSAEIYEGQAIVYQDKSGLTHFKLSLPLEGCASAARARFSTAYIARRRRGRSQRSIYASTPDTGFETDGRDAEGGTEGDPTWLTVDECTRTIVKVTQGVVHVRDLVRHRSLVVRAGHTYVAAQSRRRRAMEPAEVSANRSRWCRRQGRACYGVSFVC